MNNLLHLQNGSDIRGIAIDTKEQVANLTVENVKQITRGILNWLLKDDKLQQKYDAHTLKIGVGRDSRLSGEILSNALISEASQLGINVIDFGLATTPSMFMATQYEEYLCDAGIMITASHLPYYFNGIKIFNAKTGAEKSDITYILNHTNPVFSNYKGEIISLSILDTYSQDLVSKIQKNTKMQLPLQNMKIILDAGNGAGGFFAEKVLQKLGADITGSQFLNPDGTFPNHIPNPDNKEAILSIKNAVLTQKADLGIIFDTDVDRSAVITSNGQVLNRNNAIAILSYITLQEYPNTTIVTNSTTSDHLREFIKNLGGQQYRYINGYRNIINKGIELNNNGIPCYLVSETSGHTAFKENYFLDDGAYAVAKILMLLPKLQLENKTLEDLVATLTQPKETLELRFNIKSNNYKEIGQNILNQLEISHISGLQLNEDNYEGVRFNLINPLPIGWFQLRMSLHEPLLVLQIELDENNRMHDVLTTLHEFFNSFDQIDQSQLLQQL